MHKYTDKCIIITILQNYTFLRAARRLHMFDKPVGNVCVDVGFVDCVKYLVARAVVQTCRIVGNASGV